MRGVMFAPLPTFMAIKEVELMSIQSHHHTVLKFPETGLVLFYGRNSNGKSVWVRVLTDVLSGAIYKPLIRKSLITRGSNAGIMKITLYNNRVLVVYIHREASQTYVELDGVKRYLADKSVAQFVEDFGFHYDPKFGLSINVHGDGDPFLFTDTKYTTNWALMNSAFDDADAEQSIANLNTSITENRRIRRDLMSKINIATQFLETMTIYDIKAEVAKYKRLEYLQTNLKACSGIAHIPSRIIKPKPFIAKFNRLPMIKTAKFIPPFTKLPTSLSCADEYVSVLERTCPYCNRRFSE